MKVSLVMEACLRCVWMRAPSNVKRRAGRGVAVLRHRPSRRQQHTLQQPVMLAGVGLHSGESSAITLRPAAPGTGIVFALPGVDGAVKAHYSNVSSSELCTTITSGGASVATVEHLLAALAASGVSNCVVEVGGKKHKAVILLSQL